MTASPNQPRSSAAAAAGADAAAPAAADPGAKFVILDPGLVRLGGHNHALAATFSGAAHEMGYEVLWFCHRDLPAAAAPAFVRLCPVFALSYYKKVRLRWLAVRAANRLLDLAGAPGTPLAGLAARFSALVHPYGAEITAALRHWSVGPGDHVFVTTAEYLQYEALVRVMAAAPPESLPAFHVRTSFDESYPLNRRFGDRLPDALGHLAALGVVDRRLFLYGESEAMAAHFQARTGLPFRVVGNPVPSELLAAAPAAAPPDRDAPLTVVFPGQAREEKGFLRLPAIVAELQARQPLSRPVRFVLQSNLRKEGKRETPRRRDRDRLAAKAALKRFPDSLVRLVDRPLETAAYYELLAEGDMILLPYDAGSYRDRPSMIAIEAALLGKPVVATAGTTLADLAGREASETATTDAEFAAAIARIVDDYESYRTRAAARAASLRHAFDPRTLIADMVARASAAAPAPPAAPR